MARLRNSGTSHQEFKVQLTVVKLFTGHVPVLWGCSVSVGLFFSNLPLEFGRLRQLLCGSPVVVLETLCSIFPLPTAYLPC